MNDDRYYFLLTEFFDGRLDENLEPEVRAEMQRRGEDITDAEELQRFSSQMAGWSLPEPSGQVKDKFYTLLSAEQRKQATGRSSFSWDNLMAQLFSKAFLPKLAYALVLLLVGYVAGSQLSPARQYKDKMESMTHEIQQVREVMMLALLNEPAASERLKAIQTTHQLTSPDDKIITALLKTLNDDPNENVRLAAVDALLKFSGNEKVRQGIYESIPNQFSPMVQVTMSQAMVALDEKASVPYLKQLLDRGGLNPTAKEQIEETIQTLS